MTMEQQIEALAFKEQLEKWAQEQTTKGLPAMSRENVEALQQMGRRLGGALLTPIGKAVDVFSHKAADPILAEAERMSRSPAEASAIAAARLRSAAAENPAYPNGIRLADGTIAFPQTGEPYRSYSLPAVNEPVTPQLEDELWWEQYLHQQQMLEEAARRAQLEFARRQAETTTPWSGLGVPPGIAGLT
ncbi:MAG: hypothetical protein GYA36_19605 [Veillonellaceae bacterium]|nr:hypothetical protein [Veillonellaceae bacterium]